MPRNITIKSTIPSGPAQRRSGNNPSLKIRYYISAHDGESCDNPEIMTESKSNEAAVCKAAAGVKVYASSLQTPPIVIPSLIRH